MTASLAERLVEQIRRNGPIPFSAFMEAALYDPDGGFYASGGHAGRRGDFLTSPEVGPIFGAVIARALDGWWDDLGQPDPYVVVDAGGGPGTLARTVLAAQPRCAPALRYVLVERSAHQRLRHADGLPLVPPSEAFAGVAGVDDETEVAPGPRGPLVVSLPELPALRFVGVILANELLDNLPFDLLVNDGDWREAYVAVADGRFVEVLLPARDLPPGLPVRATLGARAPRQAEAGRWLRAALDLLVGGRVVVLDYTATTAELAARPWRDWLRTYRAHGRGQHYLRDPGTQDITTDVAVDQLARVAPPTTVRSQADFLAAWGIADLVEEGRRVWAERAHLGDLEALRARSRVSEAAALTDRSGLGGFGVLEWQVGPPGRRRSGSIP